jgi:metal-dependent amidase/aminoacylase/carboxypeptidase family protein
LEKEIGVVAQGIAATFGIEAEYNFQRRIPPVVNDTDATARALRAAQAATGRAVVTDFPPSTAGDDFAFFGGAVPGCYVWLGNGAAVDGALHHNSRYDFNDEAILTGARFWTTLVEQELAAS